MKEIWKDIPEYEDLYQISNFGRIKSKDKLIKVNCSGNNHIKVPFFYYVRPGKIIKLRTNKFGYIMVFLHGTCILRRSEKQKTTNKYRKSVISIDEFGNETEYLSAWDASRKIGAFQSNIWKAIQRGNKCSGYYWKYKEE